MGAVRCQLRWTLPLYAVQRSWQQWTAPQHPAAAAEAAAYVHLSTNTLLTLATRPARATDGITDLEAVQSTGGADLFIGYGGVVVRPAVEAGADWFVHSHQELLAALQRFRVAMVGSGAWACAAVRMVAQSVTTDDPADNFDNEVRMWVHEEDYEGRKLTAVINEQNENPRYLPGISLGTNVIAVPKLEDAVADADCIIICVPHQFLHGICKQLAGKVRKDAMAISLTKGMRVNADGPQLISQVGWALPG